MSLKSNPHSTRSLQIVANILVDIIYRQDINGELPCPLALLNACRFFFCGTGDYIASQKLHWLRIHHPDVIRAVISFLMRPRSARERQALAAIRTPRLGHCSCAQNNYDNNAFLLELHDEKSMLRLTGHGRTMNIPAISRLLFVLSTYLGATIRQTLDAGKLIKSLPKNRGAWPRDRQDVFPYGVLASMTSLCEWVQYIPKNGSLEVLLLVYDLQDQALGQSFVGHFARVGIPLALVPTLALALDSLKAICEERSHEGDWIEHKLRDLRLIAMKPLGALFEFSDRQLRAMMNEDLASLFPLINLCLRAYCQLEDVLSRDAELRTDLNLEMQKLFLVCYVRLCLLFDPPGTSRPFPRAADTLLPDIKATASPSTIQELHTYPIFRICANPGCDHTRFSIGYPLSLCSRCKYVLYCSRECQREAWRHARFPHRDVCAKIGTVMEKIDLVREMGGQRITMLERIDETDLEQILCYLEGIHLGPTSLAPSD